MSELRNLFAGFTHSFFLSQLYNESIKTKGEIMMDVLLRAKDVTKVYHKAPCPSLHKVSFDIEEGEFIGIMGASGSGKTTLLNVLSTIDVPTSGDIWIKGVNLKELGNTAAADFRRDNLGFIFQEYFLLDSLTIRENISVPLTLLRLSHSKIESKVRNLAERFGIASQLDKYPGELSGGQRQRASAASFANRILIFKDGRILMELSKDGRSRRSFYESIAGEIAKLDTER